MINLLHISDLHIHCHKADNAIVMDKLNKIQETYPEDQLIITGDITDDGHPYQYDNAKDIPGLKVPGNHDFGAAGNFYSHKKAVLFDLIFNTNFAGDNEPEIEIIDGVRFIGIDSNLETEHPFDFACGEVGSKQLKMLKGILNGPSMPTVVYMHHHPFMHHDPFMMLKDAKEFIRIVYGRIDVLLFGHRHMESIWENYCGIKLIHSAGRFDLMDKTLRITIDNGVVSGNYVDI